MTSIRRRELLERLFRAECKPGVLAVLAASPSLRIPVSCSQLSPSASGTGSRVAVAIKATHPSGDVLLDAGVYWAGAPPGPVAMHYTALLAHADESTLESLMSRLEQRSENQGTPPCLLPGKRPLATHPTPKLMLERAPSFELEVTTPSPQAAPAPGFPGSADPPRRPVPRVLPERTLPRALLGSLDTSGARSSAGGVPSWPASDTTASADSEPWWATASCQPSPGTPPFDRVFTPPWAEPGEAEDGDVPRGPVLTGRPGADAAARLAAAGTHLSAAAPQLAEALADISTAHGAEHPLFAQTQFLLSRVLEAKDTTQHALDKALALAFA